MKQYKNRILYGMVLMCTTLLVGCTQEPIADQEVPNDGKNINATFTLAPDFVEEIEVRSVAGVDEKVIKDLWVIQLDAGGTIQLQAPKYITTGFTSSASDYKVTIPLLRQASKIYFIANTHNAALYTAAMKTSALVEAVTLAVNGEDKLASANGIPMSGVWTGTPDLLGIAGRVSLSRAIAKVNFNLSASLPLGETFSLESITVKQVPQTLQYYRASLESYPYPATPTVMDYPATTYDKVNLSTSPQSLWWYLPENARGTGTATIQTDKGSKLPTGQAAYCTYLEVKGLYEAGYGTYETIYKIYLGANNYNDYNVKRNTVYNVNTTIKGIDAADTRINTVDKSIIVGLFGGWDENQKKYTKLLEVQMVQTANDPAIAWSTATAASIETGAINSEYGPTNILKLRIFSPDLSNYPVAKYCADLGNGWYLPSQNQLMAIYAAHNGIPAEFSLNNSVYYWVSTEYNAINGWYVGLGSGTSHNEIKTNHRLVRCVRDVISQSVLSPMVVTEADRFFIDARSLPAGAITATPKSRSTKATNTEMTTDNTVNDIASAESNKTVSHYFEVAKTNFSASRLTWLTALNSCQAYDNGTWRLPTQRELMLIWILKDKLISSGMEPLNGYGYWSSTEVYSGDSFYVNMLNGHAANGVPKKEGDLYVRCVRDVNPNDITIDNLQWTTGNLVANGKGGCEIGSPTDGGLYFQFGSLVGWSGGATGDGRGRGTDLVNPVLAVKVQPKDCLYTLNDWASTAKIWQGTTGTVPQSAPGTTGTKGIGDPCRYYLGGTWRLPTQAECNALFGQTPTFSSELSWDAATAVGWDKGGSFSVADYGVAKHTKSGMQLPAAGYRINNGGVLTSIGVRGNYWSASPNGLYLNFYSTGVTPNNGSTRDYGFPIRCVRNAR